MACPIDNYTTDVVNTLLMMFVTGLNCGAIWKQVPPTLGALLQDYRRGLYHEYRAKYRQIDPGAFEVFGMHHGLRFRAPQQLKDDLRSKTILDVGAFNGDSALILSEYGKDVYSFELSPRNMATMKGVLAANPLYSKNVHPVNAGVSDQAGEIPVRDSGGVAMSLGSTQQGGATVPLVTVDEFVEKNNLTIGFMKGDVEGFGLAVVKGALKTLRRDRPMISMAVYHDFEEFFTMSTLLARELPDYHWEWHMQNPYPTCWFELGFFGHPIVEPTRL